MQPRGMFRWNRLPHLKNLLFPAVPQPTVQAMTRPVNRTALAEMSIFINAWERFIGTCIFDAQKRCLKRARNRQDLYDLAKLVLTVRNYGSVKYKPTGCGVGQQRKKNIIK